MTGSRGGAPPSSRPARRRRGLWGCHTLSRVNTVWSKQTNNNCTHISRSSRADISQTSRPRENEEWTVQPRTTVYGVLFKSSEWSRTMSPGSTILTRILIQISVYVATAELLPAITCPCCHQKVQQHQKASLRWPVPPPVNLSLQYHLLPIVKIALAATAILDATLDARMTCWLTCCLTDLVEIVILREAWLDII